MLRKKLILSILIGAAVGGAAIYLFGTTSGKKELARLKKTGRVTANTFEKLGEEVAKNIDQARKEERIQELRTIAGEVLSL